ncbi:hypothetical protein [Leptolyngbya sp. CCY15150]|uniref:hypothetical protein n=1 Tax=Leptolyngbya sp. CCY15150 TaxID=2767772 RepID=UPI00194F304F|nr:hypothetical protein [Leptolyngbya sp. CCY15150]
MKEQPCIAEDILVSTPQSPELQPAERLRRSHPNHPAAAQHRRHHSAADQSRCDRR